MRGVEAIPPSSSFDYVFCFVYFELNILLPIFVCFFDCVRISTGSSSIGIVNTTATNYTFTELAANTHYTVIIVASTIVNVGSPVTASTTTLAG